MQLAEAADVVFIMAPSIQYIISYFIHSVDGVSGVILEGWTFSLIFR